MEGEPEITGISREEIAIFDAEGLDYKEWFPKMKTAFNAGNTKLMKHVNITVFDDFLSKIENPYKEALRSVLDKITGKYTRQQETKEKEKEVEDKNRLETATDEKEAQAVAEKKSKEKEKETDMKKEKFESLRKDEQQKLRETLNRVKDEARANLDKHNKSEPSSFGNFVDRKDDIRRPLDDVIHGSSTTV